MGDDDGEPFARPLRKRKAVGLPAQFLEAAEERFVGGSLHLQAFFRSGTLLERSRCAQRHVLRDHRLVGGIGAGSGIGDIDQPIGPKLDRRVPIGRRLAQEAPFFAPDRKELGHPPRRETQRCWNKLS